VSLSRWIAAATLLALYTLLCAAVWWRQRRRLLAQARQAQALLHSADGVPPLLVLHASQTGQAEELALQTAQALHVAGRPVRLAALGELDRAQLAQARQALLLVSTAGEGDAPDSAVAFARDLMAPAQGQDLTQLQFGLLALGDRSYAQFCGFGRALDTWLQSQGAQPMFPRIEMDRGDAQALTQWRQQLAHLAGTADLPDWQAPDFQPWQLAVQRCLNPGSDAHALFHLELLPLPGHPLPDWQAGDLIQLLPQPSVDEPEPRPREYTLASLPGEGRLQLLVRQTRQGDGQLGLASGQLTQHLRPGDRVALRLRAHASFRIGDNAQRPLILIGNGSGLAGLLAHLKARAEQARAGSSPAPAWLLFGERQAAHDSHYAGEISHWQQQGWLRHVDRVFSRDGQPLRHVQQQLQREQQRLREWVAQGAAIYVCGSLQGMAAAVDGVLREALGEAPLEALVDQGRYRRDVY
jgi:sulfite reductase (NADPH) flavoprotein alpha-component